MFQFVNLDIFRVTFSESGVNYTRSGLIQPQYSTKIWPYTQISTHTGTEKEAERDREERNTGKSCKSELWNTDISSYTCCLTLEILKTWSTNQSYWKNSQCKNRCFFLHCCELQRIEVDSVSQAVTACHKYRKSVQEAGLCGWVHGSTGEPQIWGALMSLFWAQLCVCLWRLKSIRNLLGVRASLRLQWLCALERPGWPTSTSFSPQSGL